MGNLFFPLVKAEQASQTVWGRAAVEEKDRANEIMDYATARPQFETWSQNYAKATLGKSFGNIRAMHNPRHLAGKVREIRYDDAAKAVDICVKILDPVDWQKVEEGGYTGFSIGGGYVRKWNDPTDPTLTRYTPRIAEISLVDSPCIPSARFLELQKRDGSVEEVPLIGHARTFAEMLPPPSFNDLRKAMVDEMQTAQDPAELEKGRIGNLALRLATGAHRAFMRGTLKAVMHGHEVGGKIGHRIGGERGREVGAFAGMMTPVIGAGLAVEGAKAAAAAYGAHRLHRKYRNRKAMTKSDEALLAAIDDCLEKAGWGEAAAGIGRRLRGAAQGGAAHLAGRAMPHLEAAADAAGPHIQRGLQAGRRGVAAATHPYRTLEERVADKATLHSFSSGKKLSTPERVARGRKWGHAARYGLRAGLGAGAAGAGAYALSRRGSANKMADDPADAAIEAPMGKLLLPALGGAGGWMAGTALGGRLGTVGALAGGAALGVGGWKAGRRLENKRKARKLGLGGGSANKMADDPVNLAIEERLEKLLLPALVGYGAYRAGKAIGRGIGGGVGVAGGVRALGRGGSRKKADAIVTHAQSIGAAAGGLGLGIAGWRTGRKLEGAIAERKRRRHGAGNPS